MKSISKFFIVIFVLLSAICAPVMHAETMDHGVSNDMPDGMACCYDQSTDENLLISSIVENSRTSISKNIDLSSDELKFPDFYCFSKLSANSPPLLKEFSTLLIGSTIKRE